MARQEELLAQRLQAFREAGILWAAGLARPEAAIRAAADLVGDGLGGRALVEVASLPVRSDGQDVGALLHGAFEELGLPFAPAGTDEALLAALPVIARATVQGRFAPRELTRWAHHAFGHDGPAEAQELVRLDDDYDLGADADSTVLAEARRLAG